MTTPSLIAFDAALVFYALTWLFIRQLVRDVNADATNQRVSLWKWHKGWKTHRLLFPVSETRTRILGCIGLTALLMLVSFGIEVHHMIERMNLR
jgi:hypothetical protein